MGCPLLVERHVTCEVENELPGRVDSSLETQTDHHSPYWTGADCPAERSLLLKADRIGKRYGTRWLFRDLSLELEVGDVLVVTGANGSGKSTLLRLFAGLDSPSAGTLARPERIGYAGLDGALYSHLTAREHLEWAAAMRDVPSQAEELLTSVGLHESGPAGTFSSGQRSRLRLALAQQHEPALLLLDEPGAALDEAGLGVIEALISDARAKGAVVVATNDPRERRFATHELSL